MLKMCVYASIVVFAFSCVKYEGDDFLPKEEYGQQDTLNNIYLGFNGGWDFQTYNPIGLYHISLDKYRYDSIFDWDPYSRMYLTWSGQYSNAWFYDTAVNGRYKVRFLSSEILDTNSLPFKDYGNHIKYNINKKLIGKPVAEVIDTVGNRTLVTLTLHRFNTLVVSLNNSSVLGPVGGRPDGKELVKLINGVLAGIEFNYRWKKKY